MLTYSTYGPDAEGMFHVGYRLPFAPGIFVSTTISKDEGIAEEVCTILNEAQVVGLRAALVRNANAISNDLREQEQR